MGHFETMQNETYYLCYQTLNIKHSVRQNSYESLWHQNSYESLQQSLEEPIPEEHKQV